MLTIGIAVIIGGRSIAHLITHDRMVPSAVDDAAARYKLLYFVQSRQGLSDMLEGLPR